MRQKRLRMMRRTARQTAAAARARAEAEEKAAGVNETTGAEGEKPDGGREPARRIKIQLLADRAVITEVAPDGTTETHENKYNGEALMGMDYIARCADAGFDIDEAWTCIDQGIFQILDQGFIPRRDEFYELTPEQYRDHYAEIKKLKKPGERLYMLLPKNPAFQKEREVGILTETQITWFEKAAKVIECYCAHYQKRFDSEREKLAWLTTVLPPTFSKGTAARRDLIRLVK